MSSNLQQFFEQLYIIPMCTLEGKSALAHNFENLKALINVKCPQLQNFVLFIRICWKDIVILFLALRKQFSFKLFVLKITV